MINPINNNAAVYKQAQIKNQEGSQGEFERAIEKAVEEKDEKKLRKACSDLEAIFVNMMFKEMRNTIQKANLMEEGMASEMYEDMLFDKYTEEIAKGKGVGISEILYKQLSKSMKKGSEDQNAE